MAEKKFLDFMDRFDGGGMGKSGDKFEGGGLLSLLGNIFATPRGSEDRAKEEALAGLLGNTRPNMRPTVGSGNGLTNSTSPEPTPALAQSPLEMFGGQQPAPYSPTMQGSGMTPANNYAPSSDPFSYSGDREAGMAGNVPTPGRYDFGLPDDANDFGINPNVAPNPFAGMPGVGGDGRSLDGEILRYAPTGLPEISPELGFDMPDGSSDYRAALRYPLQRFAEQLVEIGGVSPEVVQSFIQTSRGKELYTKYVNGDPFKINGKKFPNY